METETDIKSLEETLEEIKKNHKQVTSVGILIIVVLIIFAIFWFSNLLKASVANAIADENIPGQIVKGFDDAISNFEVIE